MQSDRVQAGGPSRKTSGARRYAYFCGLLLVGLGPALASRADKPEVPVKIPQAAADGIIYLPDAKGMPRATTLDPYLQNRLSAFLVDSQRPIAAAVIAEVKTGSILAMVEGRSPETWGGRTHTALHNGFPAASLFKTVVTAAAFEVANLGPLSEDALPGGCGNVRPTGEWLLDRSQARYGSILSLKRAYGASCNGFFAKLAINELGLGVITDFARRLGWEGGIPADFHVDRSPFLPPSPRNSSAATVGRFAAGFGHVGFSAVHGAWMMVMTAHGGRSIPLRLFRDTPLENPNIYPTIIQTETARNVLDVMQATVRGGTGKTVFGNGKYRRLMDMVGGKTGTLTGSSPRGLTTLFTGLAPLDAPEIAISTIVVLDKHWHIKSTTLAAESVLAYMERKLEAHSEPKPKVKKVARGRVKAPQVW